MSFKKTFLLEFTDFQDFPGPTIISKIFKDFTVLENTRIKFNYFPGFPGPIRTLYIPRLTLKINFSKGVNFLHYSKQGINITLYQKL